MNAMTIGLREVGLAERARKRLEQLIYDANMMFLAVHDPASIMRFCNRANWLLEGEIRMDGPPDSVLAACGEFSARRA